MVIIFFLFIQFSSVTLIRDTNLLVGFCFKEKHVVFDVQCSEKETTTKTGRLHRRDTPHHLKNKRIAQVVVDPTNQEKDAILTAVSEYDRRVLLKYACTYKLYLS